MSSKKMYMNQQALYSMYSGLGNKNNNVPIAYRGHSSNSHSGINQRIQNQPSVNPNGIATTFSRSAFMANPIDTKVRMSLKK